MCVCVCAESCYDEADTVKYSNCSRLLVESAFWVLGVHCVGLGVCKTCTATYCMLFFMKSHSGHIDASTKKISVVDRFNMSIAHIK